MKIYPRGNRVVLYRQTDGRTDGRTDRSDDSNSRFSQFCEKRLNIGNKSLYIPYSCVEISYLNMINQQMHIYKYVQSHITILQQHVSVTPATVDQGVPARNATEKSDRQT